MTRTVKFPAAEWINLPSGARIGIVVALLLLLALAGNLFSGLRLRLNDVYFVPTGVTGNIVIVALDNDSLAEYGRSPSQWQRRVYTDLLDRLSGAEARVVAFDLLFAEPTDDDTLLAEAMQAARAGDARTRLVIAAAGAQPLPPDTESRQLRFSTQILPQPDIAAAVDFLGYVNSFPDVDGVIRRQPARLQIHEESKLSFSLATYLAFLRIPAAAVDQVVQLDGNTLFVTPERALPVDESGVWVQNYFGLPSDQSGQTFPLVSLRAVLADEVDPAIFAGKIVLVGLMNSAGVSEDRYFSPVAANEHMAGVEIQANAIESLIQNVPLREQAPLPQAVMIVVLALVSSLVYMRLRWYWVIPITLLLMVGYLVAAFVNFSVNREIINLLYGMLALLLPAVAVIGVNISREASRRRRSEFLLESVSKAETQRLSLAHILPHLAADLRQIFNASSGVICLPATYGVELAYQWGNNSTDDLVKFAEGATVAELITAERLALPIRWQGRLQAVVAVRGKNLSGRSLDLARDLTRQIAPALDNAALYNEVDQQKTLVEAVLYGSPAAILVLDSELRLLRGNARLTDLVRRKASAGVPLAELFAAADAGTLEKLRILFGRREDFFDEMKFGDKSYNLGGSLLPEFNQWVVVLNDVTPLVELNELKTRMIRMASHDLKNPLSRVLGYAHLLLEMDDGTSLSDQQRGFIKSIADGGVEMRELITEILDLEQLRTGTLERKPFDYVPVVQSVVARFQPDIIEKKQELITEYGAESLHVLGNMPQLSQVAANLVSNAVKYTPDGGQITVRLNELGGNVARLDVIDTGYGIPEEAQQKLFTDFYRVRTKETANISGTGLGLSLVKQVVEAHGGKIGFTSEEGKGSTFFVELPVIEADDS